MATNLEAARDIQHGHIDDSVVPGTVHLVDLDHSLRAKHSAAHKDIVLVPTPSDDPDDPVRYEGMFKMPSECSTDLKLAQLVYPTQTSLPGLHVRLRLVQRHRQLRRLLRAGPALGCHRPHRRRPQCRYRIPVPACGMGTAVLAALCFTVWEATDVSYLHRGRPRVHNVGTLHQWKRAVDCEKCAWRLLRCTD